MFCIVKGVVHHTVVGEVEVRDFASHQGVEGHLHLFTRKGESTRDFHDSEAPFVLERHAQDFGFDRLLPEFLHPFARRSPDGPTEQGDTACCREHHGDEQGKKCRG